jgi:hypothetical protein
MSKIPQGEWSAIAARYAKGETISNIAQSYGCTPPAIHYILKRNKQRGADYSEQLVNGKPDSATRSLAGEIRPAVGHPAEPRSDHDPKAASVVAIPSEGGRPTLPQQPVLRQQASGDPRATGRTSAFAAGLDEELYGRSEAAIAAFRSSFEAALAEGSPGVRQKLRQAASDLMRVAARTTIVLDRLNASAERERARVPEHFWSDQGR